jgi:hypothetical protein
MENIINKIKFEPIDISLENQIISSIKLDVPECYKDFDKIHYKNFEKYIEIVESISNIVIKNYIYTKALEFDSKTELIQKYNKGTNILDLAKKYLLPPLYLLNFIFKEKYNRDIKYINKNKNILDKNDYKSYMLGYNNDTFTLEYKINKNDLAYKEYIKHFLYTNNVNFIENNWGFELIDGDSTQYKWILC